MDSLPNAEFSSDSKILSHSVSSFGELSDARESVIRHVYELEECWRLGALSLPLSCADVRSWLGPAIGAYEQLSYAPDENSLRYRPAWVEAALNEFRLALRDCQKCYRTKCLQGGRSFELSIGDVQTILRSDQVIHSRLWGISIEPEEEPAIRQMATRTLRAALDRLANELSLIGKMCKAVNERRIHPDGIRWRADGAGILFEHIITDILNEDIFRARRATLFEDLFEWTDLRVNYEGLPRKNGARVQVKLVSQSNEKLPSGIAVKTHVVLSPGRLADYLESFYTGARTGAVDPGFWEALGSHPADANELGGILLNIFDNALRLRCEHALGPMMQIAAPIRALVRMYVRDESFEAAMRMIDVVNTRPNAIPAWIRRRI